MVLLIIIPMKNGYFIGGIPRFQTYPDDKYDLSIKNGDVPAIAILNNRRVLSVGRELGLPSSSITLWESNIA